LHDNDAMGIGVFGATDVVVRKNDLYRNGSGRNPNPTPGSNTMNGAGAWWDTTQNVTAEWHNAWGNRGGWTGNGGTGLDADRNTVNSVIQNNYLHDNANYGV
ncbi:right-handed parallel beta-helix repeat-containing protein, partial [Staphylococcus aureus]